MSAGMATARNLAKSYGLSKSDSEDDLFKLAWDIKDYGTDFASNNEEKIKAKLKQDLEGLAKAIKTGQAAGTLGHKYIRVRDIQESFVIFSDHHLSHSGNRQNFMTTSGNLDLYTEVLSLYNTAEYVVVENGDVEDLLVREPKIEEFEERLSILKANKSTVKDVDSPAWGKIQSINRIQRLKELGRIVDNQKNSTYYAILSDLQKSGRLVRLAGNHDYDLQKPEFFETLQRALPGIEISADYLFIEDKNRISGEKVRYAVLHGHQFDETCTPSFAPMTGELYSETISWAYQGADRVWWWKSESAPCIDWVYSNKTFKDNLVSSVYGEYKIHTMDYVGVGAIGAGAIGAGTIGAGVIGAECGFIYSLIGKKIIAGIAGFVGDLHQREGWETVFGHNIAWEYFTHSDPQDAYDKEVVPGISFFKFRHMNEYSVRNFLLDNFPDKNSRPTLVLGHTHEPRLNPDSRDKPMAERSDLGEPFAYYLNSGAAGRFQNLIWAIEIVGGEATLVSWSRPEVGNGAPERRTYTDSHTQQGGELKSSATPSSIPVPVQAQEVNWLAPVLHCMLL